jgi:hypothetical protein
MCCENDRDCAKILYHNMIKYVRFLTDCGHQIAERECFRFHFQVNLRVNVRNIKKGSVNKS